MIAATVKRLTVKALAAAGYTVSRIQPRRGLARLTANVLLQDHDVSLLDLLREVNASDRLEDPPATFVHVVNPFSARALEQKLTFESMRQARSFYESHCREAETAGLVKFVAAAFDEDSTFACAQFEVVSRLQRSALDLARFRFPRKLPVLRDVLEAGRARANDGDFLIYTNSDICVAPTFYSAANLLIRAGFDAFSINRRTIEPFACDPALLPLMGASMGRRHTGFDCFVFPAEWLDSFASSDVLIGALGMGRWPLYNLVARASMMVLLNSLHLTFHVGDDRAWADAQFADYHEFNARELRTLYARLSDEGKERLLAFGRAIGEDPTFSNVRQNT